MSGSIPLAINSHYHRKLKKNWQKALQKRKKTHTKMYAPKYDKYLAGTGLLQLKGHLETNLQAARLQSRMALFGSY
jgi:hypothetical protein